MIHRIALHPILHPNQTLQRHLRCLHILHDLSRLSGILHADPQGPGLLVHLEAAGLCLHRPQHRVERIALEEAVLLVGAWVTDLYRLTGKYRLLAGLFVAFNTNP